jgi:hypothetical protein
MRKLLLIAPTRESSFWTLTIQIYGNTEIGWFLAYTIGILSLAGCNLLDGRKGTDYLNEPTQEINFAI